MFCSVEGPTGVLWVWKEGIADENGLVSTVAIGEAEGRRRGEGMKVKKS